MRQKEVKLYESDKTILRTDLVDALEEGELAFMLGAGISMELDLPDWSSLVEGCKLAAVARGLATDADFSEFALKVSPYAESDMLDLALLIKKASGGSFHDIIADQLYKNWGTDWEIIKSPITIRAIAILMMGSKRGRIRTVINYNFDSLLEWYLLQHGYVVSVVETLPKVIAEGDVTIFHPHGYLPGHRDHGHRSNEIVFDAIGYAQRAADSPWSRYIGQLLTTKVFLAVGLSGEDRLVRAALAEAAKHTSPGNHPIGFWFCIPGGISTSTRVILNEFRVAIIEFGSFGEIAAFLVSIARSAAGNVRI